jgi:hypothetical protein
MASGSHDERKTPPLEQSIEPGELNDMEVHDEDRMQGGRDSAESGTALWFSFLLQVSKNMFKCSVCLMLFQGMAPIPESTPKVDADTAKVAYAHETLYMIQAETIIAECAHRRSIASSRPLELHMMRKRENLKHAQAAFRMLCLLHNPRHSHRSALPDCHAAMSLKRTRLPDLEVEARG